MKIKTSELTGAVLDWAVAMCLPDDEFLFSPAPYLPDENGQPAWFNPSTSSQDAFPIIDREGILFRPSPFPNSKFAACLGVDWDTGIALQMGSTPLVAAMRCFVASRLGQEIDVPDELLTASEVATESAAPEPTLSPQRPRGG